MKKRIIGVLSLLTILLVNFNVVTGEAAKETKPTKETTIYVVRHGKLGSILKIKSKDFVTVC